MKRVKNFLKEEIAAAQMIEAAIIYPIVFLIIFLMIYMGLYILQAITIGTYAQKIAMLASREISQPGYYIMVDKSKFSSGAIEMDVNDVPTLDYSRLFNAKGFDRTSAEIIYRYWGKNALNQNGKEYYEDALSTMVSKNSILVPENDKVTVTIECENNFIAQFVNVTVEQELMHFALLDFFGIESPKISATAKATVSDTDELVRNVDFAVDAISALAQKLGIDVTKVRDTVDSAFQKLGIKY